MEKVEMGDRNVEMRKRLMGGKDTNLFSDDKDLDCYKQTAGCLFWLVVVSVSASKPVLILLDVEMLQYL